MPPDHDLGERYPDRASAELPDAIPALYGMRQDDEPARMGANDAQPDVRVRVVVMASNKRVTALMWRMAGIQARMLLLRIKMKSRQR